MKHSNHHAALAALAIWPFLSGIAHACPMCFNGNQNNQTAFLYGSLFLMIMPVSAIGSLVYWAWKRYKALELASAPPSRATAVASDDPAPQAALRLIRR